MRWWRDWDWSIRIVALGIAAAAIVAVRMFIALSPGPGIALLLAGISLVWGGMIAAAILLAVGGIARLWPRAPAVLPSQGPALALLAVGAGTLFSQLVLVAIAGSAGVSPETMVLLTASVAAVGIAWWQRRATVAIGVGLAVGAMLLAEIPRELGYSSIEWTQSNNHWMTESQHHESCNGSNLGDAPLSMAAYQPDYVIDVSGIGGSLGEQLHEQFPLVITNVDVTVIYRASGEVDFGGVGCYLPLYRTGETAADLRLDYTYTRRMGSASISCSGSDTIQLQLEASSFGIASCRNLREDAAEAVMDALHGRARAIAGHGR